MSVQVICSDPERIFEADAVVSAVYKQTVDVVRGGLPEATMEVVVRSQEPLALQKEQKLTLYWNGQLKTVQHVTECTRIGESLYRICGKFRLEYLQTTFLGAMYTGENAMETVSKLLEGRELEVDIPLTEESLNGYVPRGTRAEALQQIVFGMGAVLTISPGGALWLRQPEMEDVFALEPSRLEKNFPIRYLRSYTRFELAEHRFTKGVYAVVLKDREEYPPSEITLTFSKPYWYYNTDGDSGEILEEGPNHVVILQPGRVTLYGKPYLQETFWHTLPGESSQDPEYSCVLTVRDMTLVGSHNVETLLARLQEMGQLRQTVTGEYVVKPGEPMPQPGDPVSLGTPWGATLQGFVTGVKMTLLNHTARLELTVCCKEAV